jgi:hypothetical protein
VSQLAFKVDALVDSHTRLYGAVQQLSGAMQELAEAQKVTEQKLQAFIKSLEKGHDGRE